MLSGSPHYSLVTDYDQDLNSRRNRWQLMRSLSRYISHAWQQTELDGVFAMKLSPNGSHLIVVHQSGQLSLWTVPSLRLIRLWSQNQQPGFNDVNEEIAGNPKRRKEMKEYLSAFFLSDVNWWSDEAVILARGTGAVTVSSTDDLINLLGSSPEWFCPAPQLSMAVGGGFLAMECECKYRSLKRHLLEGDGHTDCEDSDDDMEATVVTRTTRYVRHALYFVTDMERFQPPRKKPRMVTRTYRLLCLKSTTPEELYARKIEHEEYGNALSLARAYSLDCDLVYQRQWRKSPVSVASIQDYLSKISKRSWVLRECLERVPDDYDAMLELLRYGLRGTDLEAVVAIGEGRDAGRFILCDHYDEDDLEPLDPYDPVQVEAAEEAKEEVRVQREALLAKINFDQLSIEQQELCQARLKFLQYQDRLHTYEEILGGMHCAGERYDCSFFQEFRSQNIVQLATDYARMGDIRALDIIFANHGAELNEHRLAILSNFPETLSPNVYAELLPEIGEESNEMVDLPFEPWRKLDWCQEDFCKKNLNLPTEDSASFLYDLNPEFKKFRGLRLSAQQVGEWYKLRALEIECLSCQVDNSLSLIRNAQQRNIKGLESLQDDFVVMETLVYECLVGTEFTFAQLLKMSNIEKLKLMMSLSSTEMYTKNLHRWLLPFLQRVDEREANASHTLLREYLISMATDDLSLCLKVFEASKANLRYPIIIDEAELMSLALECIYASKRDDQVSYAFGILECLPQRDFGVAAHCLESLHNRIDLLECHLSAAELLEKHKLPQTVAFIRDSQHDAAKTKELFVKLTRVAGRKSPAMNEEHWMHLLTDMLSLQEKVYQCVPQSTCYEIFVESLLCSGSHKDISLAGKMLTSKSLDDFYSSKVSYERSVELILSSAREYFDSAASLTDASMDLARSCLSLIGDRPVSIVEELSLIESLAMLDGFGISMLPVQVRMCSDRLTLVQKAIDVRPKVTYKNSQRLLKLAFLLNIPGASDVEKQGRVLKLVTKAALSNHDYSAALEHCMLLMQTSYAPIWTECKALGECPQFTDIQAKSELLAFAVTHCSPGMIVPILTAKSSLETQLLKRGFNRDSSSSERDSESPESSRTAIQQTKDFIASSNRSLFIWREQKSEVVSSAKLLLVAGTVFSAVSDSHWWKKNIQHFTQTENLPKSANDDLSRQGCHPFYEGIIDNSFPDLVGHVIWVDQPPPQEGQSSLLRSSGSFIMSFTALSHLAEESMPRDATLCLGYLLAFPSVEDVTHVFESQPSSSLSLQLAAYYFSLRLFLLLKPESQTACLNPIFYNDPNDLIARILSHIRWREQEGRTEWPDGAQELAEKLLVYNERLIDLTQAKLLEGLQRGVDVVRFTTDEEYKRETILGLAMTSESSVYDLAISLAQRYKVSIWDVYMVHVEYLFDCGMETKDIHGRISRLDLLQTLTSDPNQFAERMKRDVYPTISGLDHDRLICYFSLLDGCPVDGQLKPDAHIWLLKKIAAVAKGLDYKQLTSGKANPLDVLRPVLTAENVLTIGKISAKIPNGNEGGFLQPSSVYCMWATRLFWHGAHAKQSTWSERFDSCVDFTKRLSPEDYLNFSDAVCFVPQSMDELTIDERKKLLQKALQFAQGQTPKNAKNRSVVHLCFLNCVSPWADVASKLRMSIQHLERLSEPIVQLLSQSDDDDEVEFSRMFDVSRSQPDAVNELLVLMVKKGQTPENVQELSSLVEGKGVMDAAMATTEALSQVTRTLKRTGLCMRAMNVCDVCVCCCFRGDLVSSDLVMELLRPFCADVEIDVRVRLRVLRLLEECFDLSPHDLVLLLVFRTEAIVKVAWPDTEVIIAEEASRLLLFETLLSSSEIPAHFSALSDLLRVWPSFENGDPWCALMVSCIKICHSNEAAELVISIIEGASSAVAKEDEEEEGGFTAEVIRKVSDSMVEAGLECSAVKCLLLSDDKHLHTMAAEKLHSDEELIVDEQMAELILRKHLTVQIVDTPAYPAIVNHLLVNHHSETPPPPYLCVKVVANELREAGLEAEAGSLLMKSQGVHRGLQSFDLAVNMLAKWFSK
ncbi:hypothetical protein CAPTEDRAFT_162693 [Capitella teleta]|uniref:Neuroblastoma-amplified sequence N-terminal domain-containing protein n=1 Tax=Capitella teleta TaxID=283909 RepID=R7T8S2_CAPTE|nr:hypothetical protein CAPTEDRAFT_162693 [Capitella teleta]|eukprot:ELT90143.1 hypothetical protein CAPTEDRAFT_162693 [Capitella teleta]